MTTGEADAAYPPAIGPFVRVAACQVALQVGHPVENADAVERAIRSAASQGARLAVVPELAVSGYVFTSVEEARALAEPLDGPTVRRWTGLARELDLVVVGGLCEDAGDTLFNSSVIVDASGLRARYRKVHLWNDEPDFFTPGSDRPPVVDTAIGRIGTMVCYDLEFPEWTRIAGLAGAEILAAPTNWPAEPQRARPTPMEVVRAQAAASTNRMVVVAADRCGPERGVEWTGGSSIISADGHLLAGPPDESAPVVLVADVDLGAARDKRVGPRNHPHRDRRTDLYG
jgi:5-aminopentanamidase